MEKSDIISFFDSKAPFWDSEQVCNDEVINKILDNCQITGNTSVLDVACGTGVLFPYYLERGAKVTAVDISSEMVKIASAKFPQINVHCGDVEETQFESQFDVVMVYNAFPHFPDPERLVEKLVSLVKRGGRLSVAHGLSREVLHKHHSEHANKVSILLPEAEELAKLFEPWFNVDIIISDDRMYQVAGVKK